MSTAPDFEALSVESATVVVQLSAWQRVRRNTSVRIGGTVMLLLLLIALAAPWLGTVDPSLFDPASRDLMPGKMGEITTLEGEQLKHRFLMGSDSFGRDIYSRVIYGTQVSLIVGLCTAIVAMMFGIALGLAALPILIVLVQNDTGTVLILGSVALSIIAVSGARTRWVVGLIAGAGLIAITAGVMGGGVGYLIARETLPAASINAAAAVATDEGAHPRVGRAEQGAGSFDDHRARAADGRRRCRRDDGRCG